MIRGWRQSFTLISVANTALRSARQRRAARRQRRFIAARLRFSHTSHEMSYISR